MSFSLGNRFTAVAATAVASTMMMTTAPKAEAAVTAVYNFSGTSDTTSSLLTATANFDLEASLDLNLPDLSISTNALDFGTVTLGSTVYSVGGANITIVNGVTDDAMTIEFNNLTIVVPGDNPAINFIGIDYFSTSNPLDTSSLLAGFTALENGDFGIPADTDITFVSDPSQNVTPINSATTVTSVPEPSSAALLSLGALTLVMRRKRDADNSNTHSGQGLEHASYNFSV